MSWMVRCLILSGDQSKHTSQVLKVKAQAGDMLRQMREVREMNWGAQGSGRNRHQVRSRDETVPTLSSIGITKSQSPPPGTDHGR